MIRCRTRASDELIALDKKCPVRHDQISVSSTDRPGATLSDQRQSAPLVPIYLGIQVAFKEPGIKSMLSVAVRDPFMSFLLK